MCRWFAYISNSEPALLDDVLVAPPHSITKQVSDHYLPKLFHHVNAADDKIERQDIAARNKFFNDDGTGIGWYTHTQEEYGECQGPRPTLYKTAMPPINDMNFRSLSSHTASKTIFAHVRMATSIVHQYNCHPFAFGRHIFMHNGGVELFSNIRRALCAKLSEKAFANVQGSSDSEHVAALYMTYLAPQDDWERTYTLREMKDALDKAITTILELQAALPASEKPSDPAEIASSLNLCTTDGEQLLAVRFRNAKGDLHQPPSLYVSTTAGPTLNSKFPSPPKDEGNVHPNGNKRSTEEHGAHVIVASEPTTFVESEWELIGKNEAVMVGRDMSVTREAVNAVIEY